MELSLPQDSDCLPRIPLETLWPLPQSPRAQLLPWDTVLGLDGWRKGRVSWSLGYQASVSVCSTLAPGFEPRLSEKVLNER